jgi:hypothetical protein
MTDRHPNGDDSEEGSDRPSFQGQPVFKGDFDEDDN